MRRGELDLAILAGGILLVATTGIEDHGLALIDNTLWSGRVADPEVADADTVALRHFNEVLHRDERIDLSLLPMPKAPNIYNISRTFHQESHSMLL